MLTILTKQIKPMESEYLNKGKNSDSSISLNPQSALGNSGVKRMSTQRKSFQAPFVAREAAGTCSRLLKYLTI